MIKRRIGAFALAAALCAGMMAGCSPKEESQIGEDGVLELEFYNADGEEDLWDNAVAEAITEATGVRLKIDYPVAAQDMKVALMIAEQNFPDIIYAKGDAASLIDAGALLDLTDLIEEYGPNIKKLYGDQFDKLKYSKEDPSIYQLSSYAIGSENYKSSGTAQIQWDVLKENNYEVPRTLDELEKMLKDYIAAHPTTDKGLSTIGFTLSASDWHWMITLGNPAGTIANGEPDNGQWLVDENYNAVYKFRSDEEREYFRWMNRMYNEGILDPEFATQTHEDYIAKISSGRVLALFDTDWDYEDAERVLKSDGKLGKTYAPLPMTMNEDVKCPLLMDQGLVVGQGVAITTACKYPVEAIKFIDYLCSDEGQVLTNWGIKDVNYFVDENGKRYRTPEEIEESSANQNYKKETGVGRYNFPFPAYGTGMLDATGNPYTTASKEAVIAEYNEEQKAACEAWGVDLLLDIFPQKEEFEIPEFPPIWAYVMPAEFTDLNNKLDEVAWSSLITCVIGKPEAFDANYDAMIASLEATGMSRAEEILTEMVKDKVALVEE
ncbi:MAG: extracellular solute-binding protein [Lachnospiraceae bacterium]|nr:extracellular solute-binding protein [Lachnospiraceae bacterium]